MELLERVGKGVKKRGENCFWWFDRAKRRSLTGTASRFPYLDEKDDYCE